MDSDKVLVMNFGEAVEYDHPHVLLRKNDGYFTKMVQQTGSSMSEHLKNIAKKVSRNNNFADIHYSIIHYMSIKHISFYSQAYQKEDAT